MLSTANLLPKIQDVPSAWIFQNYCNIVDSLAGQEIKITSVFKPTERTPSMVLYPDGKKYKFNDFSTGRKGDGIDLVKYMFGLDNRESTLKILNDYNNFVKNNGVFQQGELKAISKYKVIESKTRLWNTDDAKFWMSFHIGSRILAHYEVKPLESYTLIRTGENGPEKLEISKPYCYGYFKRDGTLYKIYQPFNTERKFLKVISGYVQGSEQCTGNNPYLLLTSSLKDTLCIRSLGIKKMDFESPDSENNILDETYIKTRKQKYKQILTLFDSDSAGIDAMRKYKQMYDINYVFFNMAKDPSDGAKKFGPKPVLDNLVIKINSQLIAEL